MGKRFKLKVRSKKSQVCEMFGSGRFMEVKNLYSNYIEELQPLKYFTYAKTSRLQRPASNYFNI